MSRRHVLRQQLFFLSAPLQISIQTFSDHYVIKNYTAWNSWKIIFDLLLHTDQVQRLIRFKLHKRKLTRPALFIHSIFRRVDRRSRTASDALRWLWFQAKSTWTSISWLNFYQADSSDGVLVWLESHTYPSLLGHIHASLRKLLICWLEITLKLKTDRCFLREVLRWTSCLNAMNSFHWALSVHWESNDWTALQFSRQLPTLNKLPNS